MWYHRSTTPPTRSGPIIFATSASPSDYCHVDATYNLQKFIVYVSEVEPDNGPFTYVRETHRASRKFWDGLIRRANDHAGLSWTKPQSRRLFNELPKFLQRKTAFGIDLPPAANMPTPFSTMNGA